jgi:putative hydrolase
MPRPSFFPMTHVTPDGVNREFHLHTRWTDGTAGVLDVVRRCEERGLAEIAFTDHVRKDSAWFPHFADEVREVASSMTRLKVFVGCEARIQDFDGTLDISDEIRSHCDLVLASVHRFPGPDGVRVPFSRVPKDRFAGIEHRLAMAFLRRGGADVLAHPGGMSLRHGEGFPDEYYLELAEAAKAGGIAVELNASYMSDLARVIPLFRRVDPLVSVGSDAHDLEHLGACRDRLSDILWRA